MLYGPLGKTQMPTFVPSMNVKTIVNYISYKRNQKDSPLMDETGLPIKVIMMIFRIFTFIKYRTFL